jgi:hypothetical protein
MKSRADGTPEWPPRPGELWKACESWPTYGFEGLEGLEILPDDVFLVIKACPGWGDLTNQLRNYVDLQVLIRGQTLTITSECFDGAPDIHQIDEER